MSTTRPYAPPADPNDEITDAEFSDLPGDVELNFSEHPREDEEFEDCDDDFEDEWDDEFDDEDEFETEIPDEY